MKVLVHGQILAARSCGIRRYTVSLLHAIAHQSPDLHVRLSHVKLRMPRLALSPPASRADFGTRVDQLIPNWHWHKPSARLPRKLWKRYRRAIRVCTPIAARLMSPDLVWVTEVLAPRGLRGTGPYVATVHDLGHLHDVPGLTAARRAELSDGHELYLEEASAVTAVSEWTRQDLIGKLGLPAERVHLVPNAADDHFVPIDSPDRLEAARSRFNLPERFLLHVGTLQPRKGLVHLIRVHRRLRAEGHRLDLVLVGAESWLAEDILAEIDHPESRTWVHVRRDVPDEWLPEVFNLAELFVMPSLLEGFGIPLLEAMACGVPSVATTAGALPEVAGDAAVLVPPGDEDALLQAILDLLESPHRQWELRTAGLARSKAYSWERSARALLSVFEDAVRR